MKTNEQIFLSQNRRLAEGEVVSTRCWLRVRSWDNWGRASRMIVQVHDSEYKVTWFHFIWAQFVSRITTLVWLASFGDRFRLVNTTATTIAAASDDLSCRNFFLCCPNEKRFEYFVLTTPTPIIYLVRERVLTNQRKVCKCRVGLVKFIVTTDGRESNRNDPTFF